jgi:small GTP-binding protein
MNLVAPEVRALIAQERDVLGDLADHLARAGAPEAESREARVAARNLEETFLLVVVGEFNSGKSSILNALLGQDVLEEGVTPTTDRISILVHGPQDRTTPYQTGLEASATVDEFVVRRELPFGFLEGVALVDTPGTNAVIRRHQVLTEGFLPRADLVLFMTSADRPFTESERQFLELAKAWGRKVIVVVNKVDLLETGAQLEEVQSFVARNAREVLGAAPRVFMVSVRRHERAAETGGDAGFEALQEFLRQTLQERDRSRLKLLSPIGVALRLVERSRSRAQAGLEVLKADSSTLNDLERQLEVHKRDLERDLETHFKGINTVLDGLQKRGEIYLDDTLRLSRTLDLLNSDKIRGEFERTVVADAPAQLERRVNEVIDRFIERNIHFWDDTLAFISARAKAATSAQTPSTQTSSAQTRESLIQGARFQYDRQGLLETIGESARREIEGFDREAFARRLAQDAQAAVIQSGVAGVGGIGLGGVLIAVLGGLAADFTGILIGAAAVGLGAFILPRKRAQAKQELKKRVEDTRNRLHEVLKREYALETERASSRLRDATAPYTRFIRAETERLEHAETEAGTLQSRTLELRSQVEAT